MTYLAIFLITHVASTRTITIIDHMGPHYFRSSDVFSWEHYSPRLPRPACACGAGIISLLSPSSSCGVGMVSLLSPLSSTKRILYDLV